MFYMNWFAVCDNKRIEEGGDFSVDRDTLEHIGISLIDEANTIDKEIYYVAKTGEFLVDSETRLSFELVLDNGTKYKLTSNKDDKYNDCIVFHNFYADLNNPNNREARLRGYSFGYKTQLERDDFKINFQPLLVINVGESLMFRFKILSNKDIIGKLVININDNYYKETDKFELKEGVSLKDIDCVLY